jgi:hypothetical protein
MEEKARKQKISKRSRKYMSNSPTKLGRKQSHQTRMFHGLHAAPAPDGSLINLPREDEVVVSIDNVQHL